MYLSRDLHTIQNQHTLTNSACFTRPSVRQQWAQSNPNLQSSNYFGQGQRARNNTTFGKNILYFMSRYHIHISSKYHFRHIHSSSQPQNNKPLLKKTLRRGLPNTYNYTVTTSHFIPTQTLPHLRLHFSPSLQHDSCPRHTSYVLFHPFMLNLLFAYPIYLINTNVGPINHSY